MQDAFLAADGPLDAPERQSLWPRLADANAALGDWHEAGLCRLADLWNRPEPAADDWRAWLGTEFEGRAPNTIAEMVAIERPSPADARRFASLALAMPISPALLPKAAAFARTVEPMLPIRAAWLLAVRLAHLSGGDALGVARARDRALQRLLEDGLSPERDLPYFLRTAGRKDSERVRAVRDQCRELHRVARVWVERGTKPAPTVQGELGATAGYVDLFFALALARLGEEGAAKALVQSARETLHAPALDEDRRAVAAVLFAGFLYRVEQVLAGKNPTGSLPPEFQASVEALRPRPAGGSRNGGDANVSYYSVHRMLEQSRLLEPQEKLNPYSEQMGKGDPLRRALADLRAVADPVVLAKRVRDLYRAGTDGKPSAEARFLVLKDALPLSGRVGEAFCVELLGLVPETMRAAVSVSPTPADQPREHGLLLESALFLAAHFDRRDVVRTLVEEFARIVSPKPDEGRYELINVVAGQSLRSLRKLELQAEVGQLLAKLEEEVLRGQTVPQLKAKLAARPDLWAKALQSLLYLAGGWQQYGMAEKAGPVLEEGREALLRGAGLKLQTHDYTKLAMAYAAAAGRAPAEEAIPRIRELLADMPPKVANTFTTAKFYSRLHLNVIEEIVLALVSDDFALGPAGHRWLEEDEYLIRRRIHRDAKRGAGE